MVYLHFVQFLISDLETWPTPTKVREIVEAPPPVRSPQFANCELCAFDNSRFRQGFLFDYSASHGNGSSRNAFTNNENNNGNITNCEPPAPYGIDLWGS